MNLTDSAGGQHLVAQGPGGALTHFMQESETARFAATELGRVMPGSFDAVAVDDGVRIFASLPDSSVATRFWSRRGGWSEWESWPERGIQVLAAAANGSTVILTGRSPEGELRVTRAQAEPVALRWVTVAREVVGIPAIGAMSSGEFRLVFRAAGNRLMEARRDTAGEWSQSRLMLQAVLTDPAVLARRGDLLITALTVNGDLVGARATAAGWSSFARLAPRLRGALSVDVTTDSSDGLIAIATDREHATHVSREAKPGQLGSWSKLDARGLSTVIVSRRKSDMLALVPRSSLLQWIPVRHFVQLEITAITPSPAWEGDDLSVRYRLTNAPGAPVADGTLTAKFAAQSMTPVGPSPIPVAPATAGDGVVQISNIGAGAKAVDLLYRKCIDEKTWPAFPPYPALTICIADAPGSLATSHQDVQVFAFQQRYPWDAPDAVAQAPVCESTVPALTGPITPYNHQIECPAVTIAAPRTLAELTTALANVPATGPGARIRLSGARHSANTQLCTAAEGTYIKMDAFKSSICPRTEARCAPIPQCQWSGGRANVPDAMPCLETVGGKEIVQVAAGDNLVDVAHHLYTQGKSLGLAIPGFRLPTVAGAIATGTHGSSPTHPAVISSRVESLLMVVRDTAAGPAAFKVQEFNAGNTDAVTWKAMRANLGYLGVVARVGLRVEPSFNLRTDITWYAASTFVAEGPYEHVKGCDFGQQIWFPGSEQVVAMCGRRTSDPVDDGVENRALKVVQPPIPAIPGLPDLSDPNATVGILRDAACGSGLLGTCTMENVRASLMRHVYPPLTGVDCGTNAPAAFINRVLGLPGAGNGCEPKGRVGPGYRIMSSEVDLPSGLVQRDWEIFLPFSKAKAAFQEVAAYFKSHTICLPLIGIFVRFAESEDTTLVAHTVAQGDFKAGETGVFFEMPVLLPQNMKCSVQRSYEKVYADLADILVTKYGGRAHWGKNRESLFQLQRRFGTYGTNLSEFRRIVKRMDPDGVFSNSYGIDLGLRWPGLSTVPQEPVKLACIPD